MPFNVHGIPASAAVAAAAILAPSLGKPAAAAPAQQTYLMKISTPTIHDVPDTWARNYGAALERDSGGRIKVEVYPASQLGSIPRQIEGTQFGSIQCEVVPPEFMVGLDERYEILAAPGLVESQAHGQRVAGDPAVLKLMLGLGADKGLHGVAVYMNSPSSVIAKAPIRRLADFKGKKIRVLASPFQTQAVARLGATPVAMTLGDVVPALQQGTIDGAVGGIVVWTPMHFQDAAKYVTETGQPAVFVVVEVNKAWYDSLPADLQQLVDQDAAKEQEAIGPFAIDFVSKARQGWLKTGGELISLPADEQASMMKTFASVGADVSKSKPLLAEAYKILTEAAQRTP
jgi:TRAP-type C4-dicarboxylate transport system substrate-binding protein